MSLIENFEIKKMTLLDALKNYPECHKLYLHSNSVFNRVITESVSQKFVNDGNYSYGLKISKYKTRHGKHPLEKVIVNMVFNNGTLVAWSWLFEMKNQYLYVAKPKTLKFEGVYPPRILAFMLCVKPEFRKLGIGKHLYFINKEIAKKKHLCMSVYPHDDASRALYESVGVKYTGFWY